MEATTAQAVAYVLLDGFPFWISITFGSLKQLTSSNSLILFANGETSPYHLQWTPSHLNYYLNTIGMYTYFTRNRAREVYIYRERDIEIFSRESWRVLLQVGYIYIHLRTRTHEELKTLRGDQWIRSTDLL